MQESGVHEFAFEENLSPFEMEFLSYHRFRLKSLLGLLDSLTGQKSTRVLNIGLSVFDLMVQETLLVRKLIDYYVAVPSMNFGKSLVYSGIKLIELNVCSKKEEIEKYRGLFDVVIFSGVLEHLFCEDDKVLVNIHHLMKDSGLMFMAVPNAASFINRIKLMRGKNIHWSKRDIIGGTEFGGFGHFREYTKRELVEITSGLFDIIRFIKINEYLVRGFNFSIFNRVIPLSWSIDLGLLLKRKP